MTEVVAADHLRQLIERIERLEEEKAALAADIREVYSEAKANGFDAKIMRKVVARRKRDREDVREEDQVFALYLDALGELPLFALVQERKPASDDAALH